MAEETTETVEQGKASETDATEETDDLAGLKSALAKEREARRKIEQESKENAKAANRLAEIEDAKKSEQEKLNEQLEQARREGTEAKAAALKLDVALDKAPEGMSLPQVRKLARRLTGSTKEELESDADELFAEFKQSGNGERRPSERLKKVPVGDEVESTDMSEWMRNRVTRR